MSNRSFLMIENDLASNHGKRFYIEIMLFCLVLGEDVQRRFEASTNTQMTVSGLQKVIKDLKQNCLNDVDPDGLNLWKVMIPTRDENDNKWKILNNKPHDQINIKEDLEGKLLQSDDVIEELFDGQPLPKHIHILVQPSQPATTDAPRISRLGGLGGTNFQGEERGDDYEGIDLTRSTICRREQTTDRLIECVLRERIILVRSPPMAGKTTLSQLLEQRILQQKELERVFRISLLWMERRNSWTFAERFKELMDVSWDEFIDRCNIDTFLIIDEIQKIYKPENKAESYHGGDIFWRAFKYIKQSTRLHIVAFASYGHYGAYTTRGNHAVMDISPTNDLKENNKWGFNDVCFTEEEYSNYFHQFCKVCLEKLENEHIQHLFNYVREITNLHPGLVAFIMNEIRGRFLKRETLTFEDVFMHLKSSDFNCHLKGIRATPQITDMSEEEKRIADTVLFKKGGHAIQSQKIPNNLRIIKTNILVSTKCSDNSSLSILDFPAPLLRTTYLQDRFGSVSRPKSPPKTFKDFINAVFAKMNPKVLRKSKGIGTDGRLLERVWQMEFYRSSMLVLPADIFASVDVGAIYRSKGYLDFYINDKRNWAIELLRDGGRLEEHRRRFGRHGVYAPIKKIAKEWAIIDIRNCSMKLPEQVERGTNDIYVLCAENFDSVRLAYPDGTKENVRLLGEEENLLGYDISDFLDDPMEVDI